MIIDAAPDATPHFFLLGLRAPIGGTGPTAERVGVFVARSMLRLRMDGTSEPVAAGDVKVEDEPFPTMPPDGPFRFESDIATYKPAADVIVVDTNPRAQLPAPANSFGTVRVDRGAGFGGAVLRNFDWLPRNENPRLALAGDAGSYTPSDTALPDLFENGFHNGGPLNVEAPFRAGDRLRFHDNGTGEDLNVTVPPAPVLAVTENGAPLDPPLVLSPQVDTVVLDRPARSVLFVWRATFPWQDRFETATLEVGGHE